MRSPWGEGSCQRAGLGELRLSRYRFDPGLPHPKAIKGQLGMTEHLSINFLPNAIYKPELCIRTTLEARTGERLSRWIASF